MKQKKQPLHEYHRFLDETGDTTFYGKGRIPILGEYGVSSVFILGMVRFETDLNDVRKIIVDAQKKVEQSRYYRKVPSVIKRMEKGGFYFHAKDDLAELRKEFFDLILPLNCSFEAIVGQKDIQLFERKHNGKDNEFYADLLSHLIKNNLMEHNKIVLNIAELANSTNVHTFNMALTKANNRFAISNPKDTPITKVEFNIKKFKDEPLLTVVDYFCWAVQRVFEQGETRFYDYIADKITTVTDLYNKKSGTHAALVFDKNNPPTEENKIKKGPQSP
jgi:Protein of unknown function (DUF3800)